jgi:hypothetical protein
MVLIATVMVTGLARADEQLTPLAISGSWAALAHQSSVIAPPDVCVVFDATSGVALHADVGGIQLRIANRDWSLPTGVIGTIVISVGGWSHSFEIDANTNAEVPQDVIGPMFDAMDKSISMSVVVGKAKPIPVSLSGSTRATNAFRTCAGIKGNVASPGSNPFQ